MPAPAKPAAIVRRRWVLLLAVPLAIAVSVGATWWNVARPNGQSSQGPTAVVTRGPMVVSVTEGGELEADKRRVISNELQWPVIIKQVVAEGTLVKEGETIIQFECKELEDAIAQQKLTVTNAENDYTAAHENLVLKKKEADNAVRKAEQAVTDADEDLRKYEEGEWPVKRADADSAIKIAERDLELAENKLNFKRKANQDPELNAPYSDNEIRADELSVERLKLSVQQAKDQRRILLDYTHPRQIRTLKTAAEDAKLALERVRLQAKTDMMMVTALDQTKKFTLDTHKDKLKDMLEQEAKLIVKADKEGLVVYDTGDRRWNPQSITIQVGEKISSRQQLMIIPDMSTLQVKTRVYEAMVDQVSTGLEAHIRLDAKPDLQLTGKVSKVAVLPDSQNRWLSPDVKVFNVIVQMDDRPEGLKPGMTAQVELVLARLDNVLSVPVASVFTEQEKTYCWRVSGGRGEMAQVQIGRTNDRRVEIASGLSEGDTVLLSPPPGAPPTKKSSKPPSSQPARNGARGDQPPIPGVREASPAEPQSRPVRETVREGPQSQPAGETPRPRPARRERGGEGRQP